MTALRGALFTALALLLLTPFIVTPGTVFPFVVGKALWSRVLIEVAFALWVALALARPAYRPPHSWLLGALALWLAVQFLAGAFGVSPQYSLWSNYERMLGNIDALHWAALALVLASTLRTPGAWRAAFGALTASGAAVACLVIARALGAEVPFYGELPEPERYRVGGPLGNPTFLALYVMANAVLATGLAVTAKRPATRLLWAICAVAQLYALALAGSVGGFAGLAAATGCAALAFALKRPGRARAAALGVLIALALAGAALGARFLDTGRTATVALAKSSLPGARALRHAGGTHLMRPSVQSRLAAWRAGLAGFAERPVLGFGPGNYATVFGRYGTGYAATAERHDQAHGKLVEVAVATGVVGLVCWLVLWGGALALLLRASDTFTLFAGAALAGYLVQVQFLFDTAAGMLVATPLLAYAVWTGPRGLPDGWRGRAWAPAARSRGLFARDGTRRALGGIALALVLAGLLAHAAIYRAADVRHLARGARPEAALLAGIEAFGPLAGLYRMRLFAWSAANWAALRGQHPRRAARLLIRAEAEAAESLRRAPRDWRIAHLLAQLYHVLAYTDPAYAPQAERHLRRARALAPARAVFPPPLAPPTNLSSRTLPDGRVELAWQPARGAGYHQVARPVEPGAWRTVLYSYEPGRRTFTVPAGTARYGIKACRHPRACSDWVAWP